MIPPEQPTSPEERSRTPNRVDALTQRARRLWEKVAPRLAAVLGWLRAAFRAENLRNRQTYRVAPRMRLIQLGTAAVAAGVLGVVVGNSGQPTPQAQPAAPQPAASQATEQANVAPAAQAAPLAAAAPQPKDQLDAWIGQAHSILLANGYPADKIDPEDTRAVIENESGGDPSVSNNWDSNAKKGTPSKGLMQTIDPTFQAFALPGHTDIWNPVDNIVAASRYSINDYGSISDIPGVASTKSGSSYQGY